MRLVLPLACLLLLAGCPRYSPDQADTWLIQDITAAMHEQVSSVVDVAWTTTEPAVSYVEFGMGLELQTPKPEATASAHSTQLIGQPSFTTVDARVVAEVDGERHESGTFAASFGGLFAGLPQISQEQPAFPDVDDGYILGVMVRSPEPVVLFLIDREGRYLWALELEEGSLCQGVAPSRVGLGLRHNTASSDHGEDASTIEHISYTGETKESVRIPRGHHFFAEPEPGTLAWTGLDLQYVEELEATVAGDHLVETDPEGEEREVFSAWDHLSIDTIPTDEPEESGIYPQGIDWTTANGLSYDADSDSYLLSLGGIDRVLQIHRSSGAVLRDFGGLDDSEAPYRVEEPAPGFHHQHAPVWTADGTLLMFTVDEDSMQGRVLEYEVDDEQQSLREIWTYGGHRGLEVIVMGQGERLANGNTFVNWGSAGVLSEVSPEGELLWELSFSAGAILGQTWLLEDPYGN